MVAQLDIRTFTPEKMLIEELAYNFFLRDGCARGNELRNWLEAENELRKAAYEQYEKLIKYSDTGLRYIWSRQHLL